MIYMTTLFTYKTTFIHSLICQKIFQKALNAILKMYFYHKALFLKCNNANLLSGLNKKSPINQTWIDVFKSMGNFSQVNECAEYFFVNLELSQSWHICVEAFFKFWHFDTFLYFALLIIIGDLVRIICDDRWSSAALDEHTFHSEYSYNWGLLRYLWPMIHLCCVLKLCSSMQ